MPLAGRGWVSELREHARVRVPALSAGVRPVPPELRHLPSTMAMIETKINPCRTGRYVAALRDRDPGVADRFGAARQR